MSERKRLAITLDPASSEPAKFKNKRIQASMDMIREESEPEVVPISPSSSTKPSSTVTSPLLNHTHFPFKALKENQLARIAAREAEREKKTEKKADSEDEYRPPIKKARVKSKKGSSRSKAGKKPNTSAYGKVTDVGGKCPKHLFTGVVEASDSDTSFKTKKYDKESHSDSLTDS